MLEEAASEAVVVGLAAYCLTQDDDVRATHAHAMAEDFCKIMRKSKKEATQLNQTKI